MFNIPVSGTMAHSWVMFYPDEYTAFEKYARAYPDGCTLLVDTYDVLESGVPNAIRVAKEVLEPMGKRLRGIRLDSGDLAYLSQKIPRHARRGGADGLQDRRLQQSGRDDHLLPAQSGAKIDIFGVGERLITARSEPVFGAVYKLVAVEENGRFAPRIKISETWKRSPTPASSGCCASTTSTARAWPTF